MQDAERFKLLYGPYRTPRCPLGRKLFCELRGWVAVRGLSAGRIPWPRTKVKRAWAFILCGDLVRAVRCESAIAVCHWWGVTPQTVTFWRKTLGVGQYTEGTLRLHRDYTPECLPPEVQEVARRKACSPEANAKKAAAAKVRPVSARTATVLAKGREHCQSPAARQKRSNTHRQRGTLPPAAGRPWSAEEDALLGMMPDAEVVRRIGRTLGAVRDRRRKLGLVRWKIVR